MIPPALPSWIEQSNQSAGAWVEGGQIGPFELVAAIAGECEIGEKVNAPMLTWDHMLDLVFEERDIALTDATILTPLARPLPYGLARRVGHLERPAAFSALRALACRIAMTSRAST